MESVEENTERSNEVNSTEDIPGGPCNNPIDGEGGNSVSPKAAQMSVNNSIGEVGIRAERHDGGRDSYDLGVHPIRQSCENQYVYGRPSNHGRNDYDFGYPPNGNAFRYSQFQPYYNPSVNGGPSNYGCNEYDFGNQPKHLPSYYNPTYYGGPGNGRNDYDFGYPPNGSEFHRLQFQPYYNPYVYGGLSNYGRNEYNLGNQPNRNNSSQLRFPNVFGARGNHHGRLYGYGRNDSDFSVTPNRNEDRQLPSSSNHENNEEAKHSSGGNADEKQDADSKIEHHKLKNKITNLYKLKAPLSFSKNSANFDKDDWVKVWYIGTEGFKLYQSHFNCPICFKKITPQNRAGAGNIPRWELTPVKGHLERLHPEGKSVQNDKGKEAENIVKAGNVGDEEASDKEGKDEHFEDPSVDDSDMLHSKGLSSPELNSSLLSSPESKSSGLTPSPTRSSLLPSDKLSDSTEPDETVEIAKKKRLKRKTNGKRGEGDAGVKRNRDECPDWKKPGVEFAWVKFTSSSRFLPAFVFPLEKGKKKREAQQILTKGGELEEKKHEVAAIATPLQVEQTKKLPKTKPYLAALKQFNSNHDTNFR